MKNKKSKIAQAHIETILSFVIFVGMVLLIFIFINPLKVGNSNYAMLDETQARILEKVSINYNYVPLIVEDIEDIKPCFEVDNIFNSTNKILVYSSLGNRVDWKMQNNRFFIKSNIEGLYDFYESNFFNSSSGNVNGCDNLDFEDYSYGVLINKTYPAYENFISLEEEYIADYFGLKEELGLNNNFDFIVYNLSRYAIMNRTLATHKNLNKQFLAREIPIRVINKNAEFIDLIVLIRTW